MQTGKYVVYMHIFPNGKRYVGITGTDIVERWRKNGSGYKNQKLMARAIQKYGWENVEHCILESNLSLHDAGEIEQKFIAKYNTTDPAFGYNMSIGGEKGPLGVKRSQETIEKLRLSHKGRKMKEETKEKLRQINLGRTLSLEVREKLREKLKGRKPSKQTIKTAIKVNSKPVRRLCDGAIFPSATIAQKETGEPRNTITRHCRGEVEEPRWEFLKS